MDYTPPTSPSIRHKNLLTRLRLRYPPLSQIVNRPRLPEPEIPHDPLAVLNHSFFPHPTRSLISKRYLRAVFRLERPLIYEPTLGSTEKVVGLSKDILVRVKTKVFPMFAGAKWRAGFGYPLLRDFRLAGGYLRELVMEVVDVLEGGYGMDLEESRIVFGELGEVDLDKFKLDDLVLRHFSGTGKAFVMRFIRIREAKEAVEA
ncbi:hypothetical protein HOY80DRAFT_989234 [Tuber brumale]|nr:hypothetical protein HOY80DRAFT_989234 [Tuber brumale]